MGRPKEYDEQTREALRSAAERLVAEGGPDALSLRAVAREAGTSTQAVYTLFGSKDGLVAALAQQAFEQLVGEVNKLPQSQDPVADLIQVGTNGFRTFVRKHPSLYRIAFQRIVPGLRAGAELTVAREKALALLHAKVQRVKDAGLLGQKSVREASIEFNAMCEGLANAELRGGVLRILPAGEEDRAWRDALCTVVRGFGTPASLTSGASDPPSPIRSPSSSSSERTNATRQARHPSRRDS